MDTACRVRCFYSKKNSVENVPPERFQNQNTASGTQGRSGLVRSALEKLSLFSPTFPVRQKYGAGNFAVCGQRLRGHVPSKNTSPAALSWSSLTDSTVSFLFVSSRCFLYNPDSHAQNQTQTIPLRLKTAVAMAKKMWYNRAVQRQGNFSHGVYTE